MSRMHEEVIQKVLHAAQTGDLGVVQVAIRDHDSPDHEISTCRNKLGDTPLLIAARHGNLAVLKYLREEVALSLEQANLDGKRALHESAQSSHIECVKYLLACGAQIDSLKRADWTPLMLACTKSSLEVVSELVLAGANYSLVNKDGWTPFHIACREDNMHIVEFFLSQYPDAWNVRSKNGRTPLHTAALHSRVDVVELLLEKCGYGSDDVDSVGVTPLMDAARSCLTGHQLKIVDMLINRHHASVSAADSLGRVAIHHAAQTGNTTGVTRLVKSYGADPSSISSVHAMTPLHYAAKEGHLGTVQYLMQLGVDVHSRDFKQRTALHMAAIGHHADVVRYLRVDCHAEDQPDSSGQMPSSFLGRYPSLLALFAPS